MRITKYTTLLNIDKQCMLVKESALNYPVERLENPESIYKMLCDVFNHNKQTEEYVYLLCFNTKCRLLGVFELSHGAVNQSICSTREIFQKVLLCNASSFVLAHNHPSGDALPSQEDFAAYRKIKEASQLMDLPIMDNIIVGDNYYSFKENNI